MPTKPKPTKNATEAQKTSALRKVATSAARLDAVIAKEQESRDALDVLVTEARSLGVTYREIATNAGRSVAWVQNSLERTAKSK